MSGVVAACMLVRPVDDNGKVEIVLCDERAQPIARHKIAAADLADLLMTAVDGAKLKQ